MTYIVGKGNGKNYTYCGKEKSSLYEWSLAILMEEKLQFKSNEWLPATQSEVMNDKMNRKRA